MSKRSASGSSAGPPSKLPPGGIRQKAQWAAELAEDTMAPSALAALLLQMWCWGEMSTPLLQRIAAAAVVDGLQHHDLTMMAALGSSGKHPNNTHREMVAKLNDVPIMETLSKIEVFCKGPGPIILQHSSSIMLPHQLFAAIYKHHVNDFEEILCGGSFENIGQFWRDMKDHPSYPQHPVSKRKDHMLKALPLALHGDGVPISGVGKSWSRSVDAWSWTSILSKGTTLKTNFLIFLMHWQLVLKNADMNCYDKFSKVLAWSLYWLFVGKWPARDWENQPWPEGSQAGNLANAPLAGGFYGVLWLVKGDLEHMAKSFKFPYATSAQPCGCCRANSTNLPWTDGRVGAAWRGTIWNNAEWLAAHPNAHPVLKLAGAGVQSFYPDLMHTLYLGIYQYFQGSVLKLLTHHVLPHSPEHNLAIVWQDIVDYYKDSVRCTTT